MQELHQHTKKRPAVTVVLDDSNRTVKKRFYCPLCGKLAFEYYGELSILIPGADPDNSSGSRVVVQCSGRSTKYTIDESGDLIPVVRTGPDGRTYTETVDCKAQFYV